MSLVGLIGMTVSPFQDFSSALAFDDADATVAAARIRAKCRPARGMPALFDVLMGYLMRLDVRLLALCQAMIVSPHYAGQVGRRKTVRRRGVVRVTSSATTAASRVCR